MDKALAAMLEQPAKGEPPLWPPHLIGRFGDVTKALVVIVTENADTREFHLPDGTFLGKVRSTQAEVAAASPGQNDSENIAKGDVRINKQIEWIDIHEMLKEPGPRPVHPLGHCPRCKGRVVLRARNPTKEPLGVLAICCKGHRFPAALATVCLCEAKEPSRDPETG